MRHLFRIPFIVASILIGCAALFFVPVGLGWLSAPVGPVVSRFRPEFLYLAAGLGILATYSWYLSVIVSRTTLMRRAEKGDVFEVQQLLDDGANPNDKDGAGDSALHYAALNGHAEVVEILFNAGANINEIGEFWAPVEFASSEGHAETVEVLVKLGAEIDSERATPLLEAIENGHLDVVKILAKAGCDLGRQYMASVENADAGTYSKQTLLMIASAKGHIDIVEYLLTAGANKTFQDQFGRSAMSIAATPEIKKLIKSNL